MRHTRTLESWAFDLAYALTAKAISMSNLLTYLNLLDKDATAGAAHSADPAAAMTQFGLNDVEQAAFLSGDKTAIAKLAGVDATSIQPPQVTNAPF